MFGGRERLLGDVQFPEKTNIRTFQWYQWLTPTHQRTLRNITVHYTVCPVLPLNNTPKHVSNSLDIPSHCGILKTNQERRHFLIVFNQSVRRAYHNRGDVTMTMRKNAKFKKEYKRLPKGTTSHFEWRGTRFVEVFTIHGRRYVKHHRPDTPKATTTINNQIYK